jgi:hypothetical protein
MAALTSRLRSTSAYAKSLDLGIREVTVKLHHGNIMRKMEAGSVGNLIRAWETLPTSVRENGTHPDSVTN